MGESFYSKLDPSSKYILLCCFFMFAVNGLYAMSLGSLLPLISAEYGLGGLLSGALISSHQAGTLAAGFLAGILPYYMGRKRALLFLCTFVIAGFSIVVLTGNPVWLLIGFLFTGISRGSISNFNNAIVNEVSGGSMSAISLLHSIFAVGALLAPFLVILSTNFAGDEGWKIAVMVIVGLVIVAVLFFTKAEIPDVSKGKRKEKLSYKFLQNKRIWYSVGIAFFYLCVEATVMGWLVTYFIDAGIMPRPHAQTLASLLWLVILAGRLSLVFMRDKVSIHRILLLATLGTTAFYILLLSSRNLVMITLAVAGLGFSMASIYPTVIANLSGTIKEYPQSLGVLLLIGGVGAIAMPIVTGALSDRFGIVAGMSAVVAAIVLMLVCVGLEIAGRPKETEAPK